MSKSIASYFISKNEPATPALPKTTCPVCLLPAKLKEINEHLDDGCPKAKNLTNKSCNTDEVIKSLKSDEFDAILNDTFENEDMADFLNVSIDELPALKSENSPDSKNTAVLGHVSFTPLQNSTVLGHVSFTPNQNNAVLGQVAERRERGRGGDGE